MARTKADAQRNSTGNYVSSSGSELGTEDEQETYQLALSHPPKTSGSLSEVEEIAAAEESMVSDNLVADESVDIYPPGDTEREADDESEEDEEDSEDEDDDDDEGSQRGRSRSVSSRASSYREKSPEADDAMIVDRSIEHSVPVFGDSNGPISISIASPTSPTPRGRKGLDGPLSPLSASASSPAKPPPSSQTPTQDPTTPNAEGSSSKPDDVTIKKPKQKRQRSPSLPPPPTRPPMKTMRMEFSLGGPEHYEVDVTEKAREFGFLPSLPELQAVTAAEEEDSEIEAAVKRAEALASEGPPVRKRRKKGPDTYDTTDPFIDDSMLAMDERKYIAQTKQSGFYVSSGEVAIVKEFNTKKGGGGKPKSEEGVQIGEKPQPKRKRFMPLNASALLSQPLPFSRAGTPTAEGSPNNPIKIDEDDVEYDPETGVGKKRKRYVMVGGPGTEQGGKRRKVIDETSFHPDLVTAFTKLKEEIKKQDWSNKSKFPADLKPQLAEVAVQAIKLNEYDEHFFNYMPVIFPYNKFTMTKLIKRTIFDQHIGLLNDRQTALLEELKRQADEGFPQAEQEHNRAVMLWEKRKERVTSGQAGDPNDVNGADGTPSASLPLPPAIEDVDDPMDGTAGGEDGANASAQAHLKRDQNPPQKKYRLTESMRYIIWELVLLSNEAVRLENEKNQLENSITTVSEQAARKVLYQKIVSSFPDGWMSSGQISRDVSAIKKKLEKEQAEQSEQQLVTTRHLFLEPF